MSEICVQMEFDEFCVMRGSISSSVDRDLEATHNYADRFKIHLTEFALPTLGTEQSNKISLNINIETRNGTLFDLPSHNPPCR